jgi:RES domain-containing protein
MVYTSDSLALALVEGLVHLPGALPWDYAAYRMGVHDAELETLDGRALKAGWMDDLGYTRAIGDQWLSQERSVALVVPSAVLPSGSNVLLNPRHRRATTLRVESAEPLRWDPRLRPGA